MRARNRSRLEPLLDLPVVDGAQLRQAGLQARALRRAGWLELAPRVWAPTPDDDRLLAAAQRYAGDDAVPTGPFACRRHRLRDVPDVVGLDVLVPHGRHLRATDWVRPRQTSRLPTAVRRGDVTVAPVARALVDTGRWCDDLAAVRAVVLGAVADGRVDARDLEHEVLAGRRPGRDLVLRAVEDARRGARSAPEAEAADAVAAALDVPFLLNPRLALDGRFLGMPDGYLPGLGIGWEVDSRRHHGSSTDLAATLRRHQDFSLAGVELEHVVPAVLRRDPAAWGRAFAATVRRRQASGAGDPPGLLVVGHDGVVVEPAAGF